MSQRSTRKAIALLSAGAILIVANWLDTVVIFGIRRTSESTFDPTQLVWAVSFGYLLIAGGVLAIAVLARWADSTLVGLADALVGGFLAFLGPIWLAWAAPLGAAPVLPEPLASFVNNVYSYESQGRLNAVALIGAGMLLVGIRTIGRGLRTRRARLAREVGAALAQHDRAASEG